MSQMTCGLEPFPAGRMGCDWRWDNKYFETTLQKHQLKPTVQEIRDREPRSG
jgi:hypothetical protein